jgi:hypothetical protein
MAHPTAFGGARGVYDAFLYAAIDEDRHGVPLTVLSTLARSNVDPWEEAARFGRLPASVAVRELAELVAGIAPGPVPRADAETIAARLQALLPRSPPRAAPDGHGAEAGVRRMSAMDLGERPPSLRNPSAQHMATEVKPRNAISYLLFYLVFVVLLICSQWLNPGSESKARVEKPAVEQPTVIESKAPVVSPPAPL